jgi:hypothetical protein
LVFFLLNFSILVLVCLWVMVAQGCVLKNLHRVGGLSLFATALYAVFYLGLPSAVRAPFTARPVLRAAARASVPFIAAAFAFVPAIVGWFVGDRSLRNMRHSGNPGYLIERSWDGEFHLPGIWALMLSLVALTLLFNLRRVWRGLHEVLAASRARAALEAEAARDATPGESDRALA